MHIVIDARIRQSSTGRYVDRLLDHLQQLDTKNSYTVMLKPGDPWQPSARNFSCTVAPYEQFSLSPSKQLRFASQLRKLKPDLVHFTMPQRPLLYFGKTVTTVHDLTILRFPRPKQSGRLSYWAKDRLYRALFSYSVRKASTVLVPTQYVANDLANYMPSIKSKIAITLEASEPPIKAKATAVRGATKPYILHVGNPLPHKNIDRLVEAFVKIKGSYPDLNLVLAGKKDFYFERLEQKLKDSPVRQTVFMPGFVTDGELKWLYENAQCYVLPSESEGFGLPGLEAMAHNCPVVSSKATCLPEVYGDSVIYFDPTNVEQMAEKISEVLSSASLRQQLIKKGTARLKQFSWKKMATETLAIYNKVG